MANREYVNYKNRKLGLGSQAFTDWDDDTIKAVLCSAGYTPDTSASGDEFLSDISGGNRIATVTVSGITITDGAVTVSGTLTFSSVTGSTVTQMALYKDTGSAATSPLLILFDTFTSGMPITPTGADINVTFNVSGVFAT